MGATTGEAGATPIIPPASADGYNAKQGKLDWQQQQQKQECSLKPSQPDISPEDVVSVTKKERRFRFAVKKAECDDKLGLDMRHLQGTLEVVHIFEYGAVHRINVANRAKDPDCDVLQVGDTILKVNQACGCELEMVNECKQKDDLVIEVMRRL